MTQGKALCTQAHVCHRCSRETFCETYTWACPWRNEDEDQFCAVCMELISEEIEAFARAELELAEQEKEEAAREEWFLGQDAREEGYDRSPEEDWD